MYFIRPINGAVISPFGAARDGGARSHEGIDIAAVTGQPIYAAAGGRVFKAGNISSTAGLGCEIDHGGGWVTKYFHCQRVNVSVGQQVSQGDLIATADNTGNAATTVTHLHFEIWQNGRAVDPVPLLSGAAVADGSGEDSSTLPLLIAFFVLVVIVRRRG